MDYEKKIRNYMNSSDVDTLYKSMLNNLFPELRESEDERMKKELIKFLQECHNIDSGFFSRYCEIPFAQMLAWLEKQGEQKPFDYENANIQQKDWAEIPFGTKDSELQEATYIIPEGFHAEIKGNEVFIKKGEQKPTWSEKDEDLLTSIEDSLSDYLDYIREDRTLTTQGMVKLRVLIYVEWLKSFKDRVQPKQEWSEEEEEEFDIAIETLYESGQSSSAEWLKSLKERMGE